MMPSVKRLGRWAFNILAGLSLLLCVAALAVSARSRWATDRFCIRYSSRSFYIYQARQTLALKLSVRVAPDDQVPDARLSGWRDSGPPDDLDAHFAGLPRHAADTGILGFRFLAYDEDAYGLSRGYELWLPTIALAALPAAVPALWLRARRRRRPGLCPNCSYDLRATPDRCPECGTAVTPSRR
jgi:hypothetical protein